MATRRSGSKHEHGVVGKSHFSSRLPHFARPEPVEGRSRTLAPGDGFLRLPPALQRRIILAGHTDDIDLRIGQHHSGVFGGYTASRRPVRLVWSERFPTRDEAFFCERKLKGWSRAKKQALIAGDWERIQALARNRQPK